MKKIPILFLLLLAVACSDQAGLPQEPGSPHDSDVILFGSDAGIANAKTKAVDDFPNGGYIGVIGAPYNGGAVDWRDAVDILDARAVAETQTVDSIYFRWDPTIKYWPMDDSELVFLAYSPPVSMTTAMELDFNYSSLVNITLQEGMPDILYASGNGNAQNNPHKKTDYRRVDLGEFRHIMSRLTVRVVADETMNPAIALDSLVIFTTRNTASYYLPAGDGGLTLGGSDYFAYEPQTTPATFPGDSISHTVLLFPGTEAATGIAVKLSDGPYSFWYEYAMDDFDNLTSPGDPLTLERAKNTILRILVKSTTVQNPSQTVQLQGILTDWDDQGTLGVTIQ